ncbi:E3 ubiquitin/ISG15 ligase TRIM25-like [Hyperolius riggenbachi]|uniref:E3 ubiquitin/ISG15 ligase TRIM25-like n=1 Tax=Hyperolius riggenbachi TaxID=752182 RepID=UPI0035A34CE4
MASAGLREELECSICLSIYTDPVTLRCGHNFCWVCIDHVLDIQGTSGGYSCPECRQNFQERPALQRNITLRNIVENFLSTQPSHKDFGVFCTHCIHAPIPAVKSCLHCEVSLCENHLRVHKKTPEHVLCDPISSVQTKKCSIHKKILEYYCPNDCTCICGACRLDERHKEHQVESLDEASGKRKKKLKNVLQKVSTQKQETEKKVQTLQECKRKAQEKADVETERFTALFSDLKKRIEDLEKRVLSDMSRQAERVALSYNEMIQQLEIKKEELSRRMRHIEELCNTGDPLTVLQESDTGDMCDTEEEGDNEDRERRNKQLQDGTVLDVAGISHTLHMLFDIITGVNVCFYTHIASDILLDVNTAGNKIHISDDRKVASRSENSHNRPETAQRFQRYRQVLSSRSFSSGRHYWEVDVGGSDEWIVGMCYPSIDRREVLQSLIGFNNKSWGLVRVGNQYSVIHDSAIIQLPDKIPNEKVRIYLDYEAGQISFYILCDPIRHLHTFTASFTETLHAALLVRRGFIKLSGGNQKM